ncbi:hypothetical protein [Streptomyces sp. NPDC058476]|uniref:hypothetical protein n=1 Tax=unclassified Streptomyces TaxID=2593676 RepID=UPI003655BE54
MTVTMGRMQRIFAPLGVMFRAVKAGHERQVALWERQLALPAGPPSSCGVR